MGAFFASVQVRAGERPLAPLVAALTAAAAGMTLLDPGSDEPADRTVFVLPPDAGGWVALYDEAAAGAEGGLATLAALASESLSVPAFSAMVHDSDVLYLELFDRRKCIDRYDSHPGYFGERVSKKKRQALVGSPDKWTPLLAAGHTQDELRAAWSAEDLFAERTLARTCELVGCDPARAAVGFRYVDPARLPEGTFVLRWRQHARPAYEREADGPPRLEWPLADRPVAVSLAVGDELRLGVTARNAGGAGRGVAVVSWGSALERGLVSITRFELVVGNVLAGAKHDMLDAAAGRSETGELLRLTNRPQQILPAGPAGGPENAWQPGADVHEAMAALARANVHVNVVGRVLAPGDGELFVALAPDENREAGACVARHALSLDPAFPRPLRARNLDDMPGGGSHLLRPLAGDRFLVGTAAVDAPRETGVALAADALAAALGLIGAVGGATVATFHRGPGRRPKTGRGKAATMLRGKRLSSLLQAMRDELTVELSVSSGAGIEGDAPPAFDGAWGVSFGTGVLPSSEGDRVPTLHLYADALALGEDRARRLRDAWSAILERAVCAGGPQAVLYRSGSSSGGIHASPYETATGAPYGLATARTWLGRWLRTPGNDRLWLGPALAAHLDGEARSALASVAQIGERGGLLTVELRRRADVRALEEALACLLPTA